MQDAIICLPEEEMKLRDDDKEWVSDEIARQIKEIVDSFQPHGWSKLFRLLRELGPIIGTCTFILGLVGAVITLGIFSTNRISQESEFRGSTGQQLKTIEQRLGGIEGALTLLKAEIAGQKYSAVPSKELKVHTEELRQLRTSLAQLPPTSPGYWPAAFQIITLNSKATAEVENATSQRESILDNIASTGLGGFVQENHRVLLKNLVQGVVFRNSIVRFDPSVRLVNDLFINCVFVFPPEQTPPKPLQEIGKALLASDLSKVTLNAS